MNSDHPDWKQLSPIISEILERFGGQDSLSKKVPEIVSDALDYVIDPVTTGRTNLEQLDSIEKTFIGLKVEHFLRDVLDLPPGLRDLEIAGQDVDVKHTVRSTWMIPPETFRNEEACLLVMTADKKKLCSFGVFKARVEYLNAGNRDKKRSVSKLGKDNIYWFVQDKPLRPDLFGGLDMQRFRELRETMKGSKRAATFFRENLERLTHRRVVQSLMYDQKDYMKRLRGNGGARDILKSEGIFLLSGLYDKKALKEIGFTNIQSEDFVSTKKKKSAISKSP